MVEETGATDQQDGAESEGGATDQTDGATQRQDAGSTELTQDAGGQDQQQADWRASIEDADLRKLAERYESPTAITKAVSDMRGELSTRIKPLGDDPSDEDLAAYRKQTGVPDTPEDYVFAMPEGQEATETDKAFQGEMAKALHSANVSAAQAEILTAAFNTYSVQMAEAQETAAIDAAAKAKETLDNEFGADKDRNYEYGRRAAKEFGGDEFVGWLEATKVDGMAAGDHPMIVRLLAAVGLRAGEGAIEIDLTPAAKATLDEQIAAKRKEVDEALARGDHARAQQLDAEERALHARTGGPNRHIGPGVGA